MISFLVTVENVGDTFLRHSVYFRALLPNAVVLSVLLFDTTNVVFFTSNNNKFFYNQRLARESVWIWSTTKTMSIMLNVFFLNFLRQHIIERRSVVSHCRFTTQTCRKWTSRKRCKRIILFRRAHEQWTNRFWTNCNLSFCLTVNLWYKDTELNADILHCVRQRNFVSSLSTVFSAKRRRCWLASLGYHAHWYRLIPVTHWSISRRC